MGSTNSGRAGAVHRSWSRWLFALAVAMFLRPAVAIAADPSASLEPEQIRVVQRALQDRGLRVEITGAWDEHTRAALTEFQATSGLAPTGKLDGATARALGVDPSKVMPVGGRDANRDPAMDCGLNNTVDCLPGA
jgi:peptidoglycan hydrolase-like protein with peptidoglycan-binding domain